jgi:hypothetical protein
MIWMEVNWRWLGLVDLMNAVCISQPPLSSVNSYCPSREVKAEKGG